MPGLAQISRKTTLLMVALTLAACGSGQASPANAGQGRDGPDAGWLYRGPAQAVRRRADFRAGWPPIRSPRCGRRCTASSARAISRRARSSARGSRSTRSTPASTARPQPGAGQLSAARARARLKPRGPRPAATSRWPTWRRSPSRIIPTPPPRRGRPVPRVAQNNAALATAQINLHYTTRSRADQRPHRTVALHRRRAGDRQPGRCAGGDHAARSDLCRYPAIGGRHDRLAPRPGDRRRHSPAAPRSG